MEDFQKATPQIYRSSEEERGQGPALLLFDLPEVVQCLFDLLLQAVQCLRFHVHCPPPCVLFFTDFFSRHIWALPSLSVTGVIRSRQVWNAAVWFSFPSEKPWKHLRLMPLFFCSPQKTWFCKIVWLATELIIVRKMLMHICALCWIEFRGTCDSLWNMREVKTEDIFRIPRILIFARKPRQNYWQGNAIVLGAKSALGGWWGEGGATPRCLPFQPRNGDV